MRHSMAGRGVDGKRPTVTPPRAWADFSIRLCRVVALAPALCGPGPRIAQSEYCNHRIGAWDRLSAGAAAVISPTFRAVSAHEGWQLRCRSALSLLRLAVTSAASALRHGSRAQPTCGRGGIC